MYKWDYDLIHNPNWDLKHDYLDVFDSILKGSYRFLDLTSTGVTDEGLFSFYKDENDLILEAPVPGLEKNEVSVTIKDNVLTVKGKTKEDNTHRKKYSFTKQYKLPDSIDLKANEPEAELKNGILQIKFNGFYEEVEPPEKKEFEVPIK